ncbi:MAG: hypothetical protein JWN30_982 [Bacilli bacterium]|nr:hypothetical protein [Bacilli bacterium]
MSTTRQQILILCISSPDLDSRTVAWSFYDGAKTRDELQMQTGDSNEPPYRSVLAAMQDGWNVMQFPQLPYLAHEHEHDTGHLPYEYILERKVNING